MTIRYSVRASAPDARSVERSIAVVEAAAAPTSPPPPVVSAPTIVTSALLDAPLGSAYSAALVVSGGTPPYVWSIVAGTPPAGITLAATGAITGTPTIVGRASFTVQVTDSAALASKTATAALSINVVAPSAPTVASDNWSGYFVGGGPFTGATGTFNVPNLAAAPSSTTTAEWVGIDGATAADPSLIQAGVSESYDPTTNRVDTQAWWEILPAFATVVPLGVAPGNQITVAIQQLAVGVWGIWLTNDTTGQSFSTTQSYSGPGTSAEWIVEAPTSGSTGATATLGQYTPNVTFSKLGIFGSATSLTEVVMIQNGVPVSEPSALTPAGFTVAYGNVTPPTP